MSLSNKVLWREGMFIRPQHFQQHERYLHHLLASQPLACGPFRYGFWDITINEAMLDQGKIALEHAKGLFEDGTLFSMPAHDHLPDPLTLAEGTSDCMIYLAIPDRRVITQEMGSQSDRHYRYESHIYACSDSTTSQDQVADIEVGKLKIRLMTDQHDLSQYTCLPLVRLKEVRPDKKVICDEHYIPPMLFAEAHPTLQQYAQELHGLLQYRAEVLAQRLQQTQQSESAVVADFMMLQLVNRYEMIFRHLLIRQKLHPEVLYHQLTECAAQLSTYTQDSRRCDHLPAYNHLDLADTFQPIMAALRHCLSMVLEQHAKSLSLTEQSHGVYVAQESDKALFEEGGFVLGVYADASQDELRANLPNQIKIGTLPAIRDLVSRGIPGVPLVSLPMAPRQIPYHANYSYFQLDQTHPLWQSICETGSFCLHMGAKYTNLRLELWAIRG
jgi:type VI secretion system protein ImpJ